MRCFLIFKGLKRINSEVGTSTMQGVNMQLIRLLNTKFHLLIRLRMSRFFNWTLSNRKILY